MIVRSLLFNAAFYLNFLVQAVIFLPVLVLPERMFWPVGRFWVASSLWLHRTICGIGEEVRGTENIRAGGVIVASKHQSAWETLKLIELLERPTFILKREPLWLPLFGWYLRKAHMIPVERGGGSAAADTMIAHARRAIAEGRQIIIFPEGTRRSPGTPPAYRRGVTRLYQALGVPCVPIALNSGLHWPRRSFVHRPGMITLQCLEPLPPGLSAETFAGELQERIEATTTELVRRDRP